MTFKQADATFSPPSEVATSKVVDNKYEAIADLDEADEEERWEERTGVITADQHKEYVAYASDILVDVVGDVRTPVKKTLDDVRNVSR